MKKLRNTEVELKKAFLIKKKRVNRFNCTNMTNGMRFTWENITSANKFTWTNIISTSRFTWTNTASRNRFTCTNMTSTSGFTWSKASKAVTLQGKGRRSISLKLKSAAWLNNFDNIDTFSMVLLFGLMALTTDSDSLMFPSSIRCKSLK